MQPFILIVFMVSTLLFLLIVNAITTFKQLGIDPTLIDENIYTGMYGSAITCVITFVLIYQNHMGTLTAGFH